jgi:hypothetical protein
MTRSTASKIRSIRRLSPSTPQARKYCTTTSRLIRDPERYIARFGRENYDIKLSDCLWHIYRMIGKLSSRIYLLSAPEAGAASRPRATRRAPR